MTPTETGVRCRLPSTEDQETVASVAVEAERSTDARALGHGPVAYQRIDPAATHHGCLVAGPSKTADIEQALVIGAHGPRALAVYLWDVPE